MKRQMKLALATLIFALTLSAFPHNAAASTTSAAPPPDSMLRKAGGSPLIYLTFGLAAGILSSVLLP